MSKKGLTLSEYLSSTGLSPEAFGGLIGVHGTTVRRWLDGGEIKSGDIVAIVRATNGRITASAILRSNGKRVAS